MYTKAWEEAQNISPGSITRLSVANSLSNFLAEHLKRQDLAIRIAGQAVKTVSKELSERNKSTLSITERALLPPTEHLLQVLSSNIQVWEEVSQNCCLTAPKYSNLRRWFKFLNCANRRPKCDKSSKS